MKPTIIILTALGLVGVVGAFVDLHTIVIGYTTVGRVLSFSISAGAFVAAWGCYKRATYGWFAVEALLWASVLTAIARAAFVAWKLDLPLFGAILGGVGEGIKIIVFSCVLFPFWSKQRKSFNVPNHSPDPTPASVTPAAVQPTRHP
jgi:hypothetical protein